MKGADRKRIARALTDAAPEFRSVRDRMVAATPIGSVLRGFCLEDSSDPYRVYVWAFVQPLCVPSQTVVLSLGKRLGGGSRTWTVADVEGAASAILDAGVEYFGSISSLAALARWKVLDARTDEYAREARAFSLLGSGQYNEGLRALRAFAASLPADGPSWMVETKARAEELARTAATDGGGAQKRLRDWEFECREALRISDVP